MKRCYCPWYGGLCPPCVRRVFKVRQIVLLTIAVLAAFAMFILGERIAKAETVRIAVIPGYYDSPAEIPKRGRKSRCA